MSPTVTRPGKRAPAWQLDSPPASDSSFYHGSRHQTVFEYGQIMSDRVVDLKAYFLRSVWNRVISTAENMTACYNWGHNYGDSVMKD
ncbi:hypothetical protein PENANT_c003G10739 [Penicillium antarcticum]|uniref:Uncharacterized protein n=1 Tax=Penicillium antarcticum TaxID=416450 RepID=A0A1V6QIG5_9EURO|nr:hypothetical protein PENANT_c003G10739 [Penicillium antarcticum]